MTPDDFRRIALSLPETIESAHMGHPDFRVKGKIFATLMTDGVSGMVKLKPDQQTRFIKDDPEMFSPVKGGWGTQGATQVRLASAVKSRLRSAMLTAWSNTAPPALLDKLGAPTAPSSRAPMHVALLRGVNVGGKNKLPMQTLAAMFTENGCGDVKTYIQSGNVVFSAKTDLARRIGACISKSIQDKLGLRVPVIIRSADELRAVAASHPFRRSGADEKSLHVVFLADTPDSIRVAALDRKRSPGDTFRVIGRDIYLCLPNGAARTKLTNDYFDRTLATISTGRNWRTVLKLLELIEAQAASP